eukprot:gnl/MRDRNA2_/MRDRNA2_160664_c0_seq1.p2 gnl/MRDRNA2_/MRDRNA2_160664_c0~~gnl/MRDRNA2_/MRDRNA2_160664_c0_seq1.p2  ORF type:complete len:124 (+),score=18.35 gnl/MRDRNA2_/MRDRNA2_160664_c0_seq1:233-604(+)
MQQGRLQGADLQNIIDPKGVTLNLQTRKCVPGPGRLSSPKLPEMTRLQTRAHLHRWVRNVMIGRGAHAQVQLKMFKTVNGQSRQIPSATTAKHQAPSAALYADCEVLHLQADCRQAAVNPKDV